MKDSPVAERFDAFEEQGIDTCTTCPKLCRWACPVAEAESRETSSPWNLVILGGYLRRGLATPPQVGEAPYHCTHCLACTEVCQHKNDVPMLLSLARSRVVKGHAAPAGVNEVRGRFGIAANPYGTPLDEPLAALAQKASVDVARGRAIPEGAQVYLPGCTTVREAPDAAAAFLRALALSGIGDVILAEASSGCCGLPLLWAGDLEGFKAHAERTAAKLAGARTVIAHDASCAHAMAVRYRAFGVELGPEVQHVSAFLEARAGALAPGRTPTARDSLNPPEVAYMDACSLTRGLGLTDAPRRLIERATGAMPIELPGNPGKNADCCGAAGLLKETAPETAKEMAEARINAFRASGAKRLAVMSPRCAAHLRRTDPTVDVVDVAALLAK